MGQCSNFAAALSCAQTVCNSKCWEPLEYSRSTGLVQVQTTMNLGLKISFKKFSLVSCLILNALISLAWSKSKQEGKEKANRPGGAEPSLLAQLLLSSLSLLLLRHLSLPEERAQAHHHPALPPCMLCCGKG